MSNFATVTGNVKDLTGVAIASGCTVRFQLVGFNDNQPTVNGVTVLPTANIDAVPDASGAFTVTPYGNDLILAGGQTGVTYYKVSVLNSTRGSTGAVQSYTFNSNTSYDLSNATPITVSPVVAAPTGDTTYVRLDGGNMPFTGAVVGKNGTAASPSFAFSSSLATGFFRQAADVIGATIAGTLKWLVNSSGLLLGSVQAIGWSSNSDPSLAVSDTGLSRTAAATVSVGNGNQGNATGTFNAATYQVAGVAQSGTGPLVAQTGGTLVTPNITAPGATFAGSTSGTLVVKAAAISASSVATFPNGSGTVILDGTTQTLSSKTLTAPVITGTPTGTGIPTFTLKKGSGAGNYTGTNTSYSNVDGTNLSFTVTIPTGWKLVIASTGTIFVNTAAVSVFAALADGGTVFIESGVTPAGLVAPQFFGFNWVINGDGASHTITLQAKTANAADAWSIGNANATSVPQMVFTLTPSN